MLRIVLAGFLLGAVSWEDLRANWFALAELAVRRDYRLLACDKTNKGNKKHLNTN
jgi:hypothetical protein